MGESVNIMPRPSPWTSMPAQQPQVDDELTYGGMQQNLQNYGKQAQALAAQNAMANLAYQKSLVQQPVQTDLSPLMALADSWGGSHLAESYKKPEGNMGMLQKLQAELDKNQQGMSEQQVQLLKAQLETQARKEDRQMALENTKAIRALAHDEKVTDRNIKLNELGNKHFDTARSGYMHDTEELRQKKIELSNLSNTLEDSLTNPTAAAELAIDRARFTVPSRLSDVEINALGYKNVGSLQNRLDQAFESAKSGTITPENYKAIKDNLAIKAQHLEDALRDKAAEHASAYARKTNKAPGDALYDLVGKEYGPEIFAPKTKAAAGPSKPKYSVGQQFDYNGHTYEFQGGDQNDQRNFKQVK